MANNVAAYCLVMPQASTFHLLATTNFCNLNTLSIKQPASIWGDPYRMTNPEGCFFFEISLNQDFQDFKIG